MNINETISWCCGVTTEIIGELYPYYSTCIYPTTAKPKRWVMFLAGYVCSYVRMFHRSVTSFIKIWWYIDEWGVNRFLITDWVISATFFCGRALVSPIYFPFFVVLLVKVNNIIEEAEVYLHINKL